MRIKKIVYILVIIVLGFDFSTYGQTNKNIIDSVQMNLSAFGVESDDFPSIDISIDFINNTSNCYKSFYNPSHKDSTYSLTKDQMGSLLSILQNTNLETLKKEYKVLRTDQASSTIIIYTPKYKFEIKDYGLEGEYPLKELYKIAYKF